MKNAKKLLSILILGTVICTHTYNIYQTSYASEAVVAGGLASAGVALLGLGAIAGVGMELDNNRRFNELSDEEKQRIENGLATNFEDVALQRGASVEKIKNWTTDLCNGVLDKSSECWGIFKDWIKNVSLSETDAPTTNSSGSYNATDILPASFTRNGVTHTLTSNDIVRNNPNLPSTFYEDNWDSVSISYNGYNNFRLILVRKTDNGYLSNIWTMSGATNGNQGTIIGNASVSEGTSNNYYLYAADSSNLIKSISNGKINIINSSGSVVKEYGYSTVNYFSTNTDYLEKLKGQDEDVIDVIDVTDIKNPIIESRPNSLARIDWNRGTRRTNNNKDDDDNKMVTGLVPMDVWYEQIDDEQEQIQNAVVVYNNYIQEHPEEKDTYFISTTPVTNINNYFNTLPVVNIPTTGTVVNNNYEYNNYNNNNVTVYQEPYSAGIIPTFPDFSKKFPFCIPFDLYEFFVVFLAEKEAPKIEVPFPVLDNTQHQLTVEHITIDLAPYEYLSDVLRVMLFVLFCVGLMILTRQLIKG